MKFTFKSDGQVLYKRKINVESLPDQQKQLIQIKAVSNAQVLKNEPGVLKKQDDVGTSVASQLNMQQHKSIATIINSSSDP